MIGRDLEAVSGAREKATQLRLLMSLLIENKMPVHFEPLLGLAEDMAQAIETGLERALSAVDPVT